MLNTKTCPMCKRTLPFSEFHKHKNLKYGLQTYCKECYKKKRKKYQEKVIKRNENKKFDSNVKKKCSICGEEYPATPKYFRRDRHNADGLYFQCKKCLNGENGYDRNARLRANHNITIENYHELFDKQKGVCAICGKRETHGNQYGKHDLSVDHNHETGEIRGLLCSNCNTALGLFNDNSFILAKAIKYLKKE